MHFLKNVFVIIKVCDISFIKVIIKEIILYIDKILKCILQQQQIYNNKTKIMYSIEGFMDSGLLSVKKKKWMKTK